MPKKKEVISKTKEKNICSEIMAMVDDSQSATGTWEDNNVKWHKMRMRIKKTKTFPFVGCANIRMPTIEEKLRKVKASLVNRIFGIRPVVQVIPEPTGNPNTAVKIEKFLDHLIVDVMRLKPKAVIGIDQELEKGFYVLKPYWRCDIVSRTEKYSTDDLTMEEAQMLYDTNTTPEMITAAVIQKFDVDMNQKVKKENMAAVDLAVKDILAGKTEIELKVKDVLYDYPDVALCQPERTYVPTDAGYDPQSATWIIHEFEMPIEQVRMNAEYRGWDIGEILDLQEEISKKSENKDRLIDTEKELREGISKFENTGKITIWEFYGWFDLDGNGKNKNCVITLAPNFNKVLRKIENPFFTGKFPFVKLFYELTDDRWFAHRGIPEMIEDIVKEIDIQHCQKIDQQTIRNTPMFVHRAGMINKNLVQFVFGQSIPAQGMQPLSDVIAPLNNSNQSVEFSYEKEQMILETKIQELIGQVDYSLQSMINKRQPRTFGEVSMQNQAMQNVFSLDADLHTFCFEELFNWIWDLWCQYGSDDYEFAYFGKEGWEKIRLTKEETQGRYKISVRGNDQNTNPQIRQQKAQLVMQATMNPVAVQLGVVTPPNIAESYRLMYQEMDIPNPERLFVPPEVLMQQMQAPQPPPPSDIKIGGDDLTDAEIAQELQKRGIQPDVQGRALKSRAIVEDKQREKTAEDMENLSALNEMMGATSEEATSEETQE